MTIDEKAHGEYKLVRAKVVDQCGTCAETQVDLSQTAFEKLAKKSTGVINMIYVIVDADSKEIIDGPHYNASAMNAFAKAKGVSKSTIVNSFKQAARAMSGSEKGMRKYPWEDGNFDGGNDEDEDDYEEKEEKKTTRKATTTHKKTTSHKKTTTTTTTTTIVKKTSAVVFPTPAKTSVVFPTAAFPTAAFPTVAKATETPATPIVPPKSIPAIPLVPATPNKPEGKPAQKPAPKPVEKEEKEEKKPKEEEKPAPIEEAEIDDFDKENGGTNAPVTATFIGAAGVVGAAGVGLLMLKRKSPQKYDDLKQKFPEAFGTVKRSITRGASTIKRGVSRSVSRRNNQQATPLPASYTFTLNTEDGLPRVALYDDPYPTKTHGSQHW